jgi:ABC-type molybdenum transport system ATPase subunit/photorepair protein PhrA
MDHEGRSWKKASEIRSTIGYSGFAMDLIIRSQETVRQRIAGRDFFLQEITQQGVTLYAREYSEVAS